MKIWKYPIVVADRVAITMPPGAQFLTAQIQHGCLCLWALVDETKPDSETRKIVIYGTGNPIPDDPGKYISTFQLFGGDLVFHAFELIEPK